MDKEKRGKQSYSFNRALKGQHHEQMIGNYNPETMT